WLALKHENGYEEHVSVETPIAKIDSDNKIEEVNFVGEQGSPSPTAIKVAETFSSKCDLLRDLARATPVDFLRIRILLRSMFSENRHGTWRTVYGIKNLVDAESYS